MAFNLCDKHCLYNYMFLIMFSIDRSLKKNDKSRSFINSTLLVEVLQQMFQTIGP